MNCRNRLLDVMKEKREMKALLAAEEEVNAVGQDLRAQMYEKALNRHWI